MSRAAADIVSLSSARETLFIGPLAAFPVQARRVLLRDRLSVRDALATFLSRPGAEETVRPYLRRWGIDAFAARNAVRGELADLLSRCVGNGMIAVARAPDAVLACSQAAEEFDGLIEPVPERNGAAAFPADFRGRLLAMAGLVPAYLDGPNRLEFEALRTGGEAALQTGLTAMSLPGVNLAVLGTSLFTLPGAVLEAVERLAELLQSVRDVQSPDALQGVAREAAGVIAVLLREGILRRYVDTRFIIKGIPATGRFGKPVR